MKNKCDKVITIPQLTGTCWFNAILMATLYSQNMRSLLRNQIKKMTKEEREDIFMKTFIDVIESQYFEEENIPDDDIAEKLGLYPEDILSFLNEEDKDVFNFDIDKRGKKTGYYPQFYFNRFLTFFKIPYTRIIMVDYFEKTNNYYISNSYYEEYTALYYENNDKNDGNYIFPEIEHIEHLYRKLYNNYKSGNFDIIIINTPERNDYEEYKTTNKVLLKYKIEPFEIKERIKVSEKTMILDSFIIVNFNTYSCQKAHAIAGITCNNSRFLYNGWTIETKDPAKRESKSVEKKKDKKGKNYKKHPCPLTKYDWFKPEDDLSFCFLPEECETLFFDDKRKELQPLIKTDVCFNVKRSSRMYVYINKDKINPTYIE